MFTGLAAVPGAGHGIAAVVRAARPGPEAGVAIAVALAAPPRISAAARVAMIATRVHGHAVVLR